MCVLFLEVRTKGKEEPRFLTLPLRWLCSQDPCSYRGKEESSVVLSFLKRGKILKEDRMLPLVSIEQFPGPLISQEPTSKSSSVISFSWEQRGSMDSSPPRIWLRASCFQRAIALCNFHTSVLISPSSTAQIFINKPRGVTDQNTWWKLLAWGTGHCVTDFTRKKWVRRVFWKF